MEKLAYTLIKSEKQYLSYCTRLEELDSSLNKSKNCRDEIDLLQLLIDKYDEEHSTFEEVDPISLLKYIMEDHQMKSLDLANLLNVSEGLVSDILHYKKGLSKNSIRILAETFKLHQEAFNRPYELKGVSNVEKKKLHSKKIARKKKVMVKK